MGIVLFASRKVMNPGSPDSLAYSRGWSRAIARARAVLLPARAPEAYGSRRSSGQQQSGHLRVPQMLPAFAFRQPPSLGVAAGFTDPGAAGVREPGPTGQPIGHPPPARFLR